MRRPCLLGQGLAEDTAEADIQRVLSSKEVSRNDSESSAMGATKATRIDSASSAETAGTAGTAGTGVAVERRLSDIELSEVATAGEAEGDGGGDGAAGGSGSGYESDGKMGTSKLLPSTTSLRVISTAAASGKSSSWFFCSKDSRFLVKTCTNTERDVLLNILGGARAKLKSIDPLL